MRDVPKVMLSVLYFMKIMANEHKLSYCSICSITFENISLTISIAFAKCTLFYNVILIIYAK
jgi:hypothetical protein